MFDFSARLQENAHLRSLLSHYAQAGAEDRTTWRDRLMQMDGVEPQQLTALHGELIAFDWIEQNTGQAVLGPDGTCGACYRITLHGLREFHRLQGTVAPEEDAPVVAEKPRPRPPRKKKPTAPEAAATE